LVAELLLRPDEVCSSPSGDWHPGRGCNRLAAGKDPGPSPPEGRDRGHTARHRRCRAAGTIENGRGAACWPRKYLSASPEPGSFDIPDELVEEYGVALGIHNHGPGDRYEEIATIEKAIKIHHPKIRCCIDTGHYLRSREDPVQAVEVFGKRVYGVHLKDVKDA
jgi:hypothetical protein